jgi:hypothetical protein
MSNRQFDGSSALDNPASRLQPLCARPQRRAGCGVHPASYQGQAIGSVCGASLWGQAIGSVCGAGLLGEPMGPTFGASYRGQAAGYEGRERGVGLVAQRENLETRFLAESREVAAELVKDELVG